MRQIILYTFWGSILFSCNTKNKENTSSEHILIHHTKTKIKNETCLQMYDSAISYADIGEYITAQKLFN